MLKAYSIYGDDIVGIFESKESFFKYLKSKEFTFEVEDDEDYGERYFIRNRDGNFIDDVCLIECKLNRIWSSEED